MADTSVTKIDSTTSPRGKDGEVQLAAGEQIAMRMWRDEEPGEPKPETTRAYETVGYVVSGRAELQVEGHTVLLEPGNSYVVPKGTRHTYRITERFTAVEATAPPYFGDVRES